MVVGGLNGVGILGITLRSIIRNPRRSLTISVGIILAVTLLVGVFLTADYMGQAILVEALKDVKVDLEITMRHDNISEYIDVIRELTEIEEIEIVEPYISKNLWGTNITKNGELLWPKYQNDTYMIPVYDREINVYGFRQNMSIGEIKTLNGSLDLTGNNIAITEDLARDLKLKIGDNITFSCMIWETREIRKVNATICAIIKFEGKLKEILEGPIYYYYRYSRLEKSYIVTSIEFADKLGPTKYYEPIPELVPFSVKESEYESLPVIINYWVFVDREKVLNPWDIDKSMDNLEKLEIKIGNVCSRYDIGYHISNYLEYTIYSYRFEVESLKYGFGFASLPVLFLAWFFALTASWISVNERRREVGLLKVRGATNKQIFTSILVEALIVGAIGGIIGAILGYLSSIYFIKVLAERFAVTLIPTQVLIKLMPFYFEFSILMGVFISLFAVIIPARRVANMELEKTLQEYLEEIEAEKWKPRRTFIMFILGLIKTVEMMLGLSVMKIMMQMDFYHMNIFLILLLIVLNFVDAILVPLGPLFFIYGLSRIVTHYASKFHKFFKAIVKPFLGELSDVAVKNFSRKSTRTARVMFLIALTLTFGITMITVSASSTQYMIKTIEVQVGADINAYPVFPTNETQLLENISNIEGIETIATTREYGGVRVGEYGSLYIIDENYFNVSFIRENYLKGASIEDIYNKFKSGENSCIISQYLSEEYMYEPGDKIIVSLTIDGKEVTMDLTIIAVAKVLPGLQYWIGDLYYQSVVVISYKCAQNYFDPKEVTPIKLLIDVSEDTNSTEIAEKLETEYDEIYSAASFDRKVQETFQESLAPIFPKFYYIEFIFALIIAVTGLSLIMTMAALERQREIGLLVARGVSRKQIIKIFLGEIILIVVISFALGIVEGISIAYGYLETFMFLGFELPFKIPLIIPFELYILLIVGLVASIAASIAPAWYITRKRLAEILRIHH